jgi:hypothetical protein
MGQAIPGGAVPLVMAAAVRSIAFVVLALGTGIVDANDRRVVTDKIARVARS